MMARAPTAAVVSMLALLWVNWARAASAQEEQPDETQIVLARAAVAECGWLLPDCEAALWATLERRRAMLLRKWGVSYTLRGMFLKYCAIFRGKHEGRRVWVRALQPDGDEPNGWPARLSWERHHPWWNRIYQRAGAYLAGEVKDPCAGSRRRGKGEPIHTGGLMDRARMNPDEWRAVDCGRTRADGRVQFFWERRR